MSMDRTRNDHNIQWMLQKEYKLPRGNITKKCLHRGPLRFIVGFLQLSCKESEKQNYLQRHAKKKEEEENGEKEDEQFTMTMD